MISAFGIDHGVVSKGVVRGPGGLPRSKTLISVGRGTRSAYEGAKRVGNKIATTEISVKSVGRGTGMGIEATGRGVKHVGAFAARHPVGTGTTVIGTGAGAGGYAYSQARAKQPKAKKPRKAPEAMQ